MQNLFMRSVDKKKEIGNGHRIFMIDGYFVNLTGVSSMSDSILHLLQGV